MLKPMIVDVKYEIHVWKYVIAENNEDGGERGYDTQRQKAQDEIEDLFNKKILNLKKLLSNEYNFEWECESSIDET